jgi:CheY-like chemotaxis protein
MNIFKEPKLKEDISILIIEQDEESRMLIEIFLKSTSYRLLFAKNKEQVYRCCKANKKIDLIIIEPLIRGINGFALMKLLKRKNKNTPIIALTVCAMTGEKAKCFKYGCDVYLTKPYKKPELLYNILNQIEQTDPSQKSNCLKLSLHF